MLYSQLKCIAKLQLTLSTQHVTISQVTLSDLCLVISEKPAVR
jgi:hypothetical protein